MILNVNEYLCELEMLLIKYLLSCLIDIMFISKNYLNGKDMLIYS